MSRGALAECNWLQIQENAMDPIHTAFLHSTISSRHFTDIYATLPQLDFKETPYGMQYIRTAKLPSGRTFGEALLDRSAMYVGLVRALLESDIEVHYLSHITGHGLLKLMRPRREFTYRMTSLPDVPEALEFLVERAGMSPQAAYSTFNMGSGFAIYCAGGAGERVLELAAELGLAAVVGGRVQEGSRRVVLEEVGVVFESGDLNLSPEPS